jgi:pimeloyl-ACP methyl ester carboxylesterase
MNACETVEEEEGQKRVSLIGHDITSYLASHLSARQGNHTANTVVDHGAPIHFPAYYNATSKISQL